MKITIEDGGCVCTVEDKMTVRWTDSLQLFKQALRGVGFEIDCGIEIVAEHINEEEKEA